jgi:acyl-[acyl carrier protein]--UDP-N-acetylglucosamine O-acyltransferase
VELMAYDPTHPSTFALFGLNNAQLARRGLSPAQIQELRSVQHNAPAARTVEEVRELVRAQQAGKEALAAAEPAAPAVPRRAKAEATGVASGTHTETE